MGEVNMSELQQKRFLELIYDNQSIFSLCDEDLGLCDRLKHTIPTTTDRPIYLPHHTIPVQLQAEVRKCLDTWLRQGIIRPSRSPYASQVVIVHKKTGEICLCIDFRALNAVTIHDSFPLPRIEEALQAVKAAVWFTSFDLAQGYLQLAMDEADIHKTAFRAGSSGLYEFTHMPFGLSNAGANFCRLMEMCLGDQQYLTLLFYLDDICIFSRLMRTLTNEQKPNWSNYLPSLVFAYNATPHALNGLQPYELMFGCKAPMPCDNWLGLDNYKPDSFKSKTVWLNQQLNAMLHANKQALKSIKKSVQRNKNRTGGKPLDIPIGNHVLLRDHPEGRNKIQDRYKSDVYVVVGHHAEPNVYYIQLLNSDKPGSPKAVNRRQLFDLNRTSPPPEATSPNGDFAVIPSFLHKPTSKLHNLNNTIDQSDHQYNTRSKRKAATAGRQAEVNTIITHL